MTLIATNWAWEQETGSPSAKVTLLVLALHAGLYGESWLSQEALARETEQSVSAVAARLKELEAAGLIAVTVAPRIAVTVAPRIAVTVAPRIAVTVAPRIAGARRTIVVLHDEDARVFARQLRGVGA